MFGIDSLSIALSFSPLLLIPAFAVIIVLTIYNYRYTLPAVNNSFRFFLIAVRTIALILILFIVFEPVFTLAKKTEMNPRTLFFIDNSHSIKNENDKTRLNDFNIVLNSFNDWGTEHNTFNTFGEKVKSLSPDSIKNIKLDDDRTNFTEIFSKLSESKENISSIVILSDGIITDGNNPVFSAEKLNIPVYTVGVGDTMTKNDIEIRSVAHNDFVYAKNSTTVNAVVSNKGFIGKNINISFYEDGRIVEKKEIVLDGSASQNIFFEYTPVAAGEKKLEISADVLPGEQSTHNNKKVFFINVLNNKVKVLVLGGSPSTDLSFIKNSLSADEKLSVNSITVFAGNSFVEKNNRNQLIDSADIFFMIGFPSKETPVDLFNRVKEKILNGKTHFFLLFTHSTDVSKLNELQRVLSFSTRNLSTRIQDVQISVPANQRNNPLFNNNAADKLSLWNSLPPVAQIQGEFIPVPGSENAAQTKINNVLLPAPMILTRRVTGTSSVSVLAQDIWKWKLMTASKNNDVFDNFIRNSVKWLNTSSEFKPVSVKTSRKLYSQGEEVEFTAQVYNASLNPVSDAEVKVQLKNRNIPGYDNEISLNSLGNGLYEGTFNTSSPGDYDYNATAILESQPLGSDRGSFNIGDVDIEMLSTSANLDFLSMLSHRTNGKFYTVQNHSELFNELERLRHNSAKEKIDKSEFQLWSNEWLLIIVVLLFAIEWFFRKRAGML